MAWVVGWTDEKWTGEWVERFNTQPFLPNEFTYLMYDGKYVTTDDGKYVILD